MKGHATRMAGHNERGDREADDFYATPPAATLALLEVESFGREVWEPACGMGHMSEVLGKHGYKVWSTDLVDRGYGMGGVDFLIQQRALAPHIVTNPPFKLAEQFMVKGLGLGVDKMALLVRLTFLEGQRRSRLLERSPLARVWVFSDRISMWPGGEPSDRSGVVPFAWLVWQREYVGAPRLGWLSWRATQERQQELKDRRGDVRG